jgi:tellurite methyltransferase
MNDSRALWNHFYESRRPGAGWGSPNPLVVRLANRLSASARVLDLGCGDGRHAVYLAERGLEVTAIDVSDVALDQMVRGTGPVNPRIRAVRWDLATSFSFGEFDLTLCHGLLNSLEPSCWEAFRARLVAHTLPGGITAVTVFTRTETLGSQHPYVCADFPSEQLLSWFAAWEVLETIDYFVEHDHDGIGLHRHFVRGIAARRPKTESPRPADELRRM